MKLPEHWARTGWRASVDGGRLIECTCNLPGGVQARVRRTTPKSRWQYEIGRSGFSRGRFRSLKDAIAACESVLRGAVRSALKTLEAKLRSPRLR